MEFIPGLETAKFKGQNKQMSYVSKLPYGQAQSCRMIHSPTYEVS